MTALPVLGGSIEGESMGVVNGGVAPKPSSYSTEMDMAHSWTRLECKRDFDVVLRNKTEQVKDKWTIVICLFVLEHPNTECLRTFACISTIKL